jgi:putative nucleotidyltransferase with HDIG domain
VVDQIEEQSFSRLKRESKAYGLGLFDRLIRIENELLHISRNLLVGYGEDLSFDMRQRGDALDVLPSVVQYLAGGEISQIYGSLQHEVISDLVRMEYLESPKSYILTLSKKGQLGRVFMGINFPFADGSTGSLIGEISLEYLWGVGSSPLLPPMTELFVFDAKGENLIATSGKSPETYHDIEKKYVSNDLQIFNFELTGTEFFGSHSNLFIESRFQRTDWTIVIAQSRKDIMSVLDDFSKTFPFLMLLFLLLILYLSVKFIRKGLEPLEELKAATVRIADQNFTNKVKMQGDDEFAELGTAFNSMSQKIQKQFHTMETVREIDNAILSSIDRVSIISTMLNRLKSFFKCDIALFIKSTETSGDFLKVYTLKGKRSSDPFVEYVNVPEEDREYLFGVCEHVIFDKETGMPSFLNDGSENSIKSYLGVPIFIDDKSNRILLLGWKKPYDLSADDKGQARQIANQLAVALTNSNLLKNLEDLAGGTIEALARTVDAKSRWTSGHSERVADISSRIAETMGFSAKDLEVIKRGGLMHDIGKIGISLAILDKPDRLTDTEYKEIKNHPSIGAKIIAPIAAFRDILAIVEQHHEKYDGTGYPAGLKGEDIDIRARILAVADVWDALVSNRPYRDGWVHDKAKKVIIEGSGSHFDPQVIEAFLAIMNNE